MKSFVKKKIHARSIKRTKKFARITFVQKKQIAVRPPGQEQPFQPFKILRIFGQRKKKKIYTQVSVRQLISHIWTFGKGLRPTRQQKRDFAQKPRKKLAMAAVDIFWPNIL